MSTSRPPSNGPPSDLCRRLFNAGDFRDLQFDSETDVTRPRQRQRGSLIFGNERYRVDSIGLEGAPAVRLEVGNQLTGEALFDEDIPLPSGTTLLGALHHACSAAADSSPAPGDVPHVALDWTWIKNVIETGRARSLEQLVGVIKSAFTLRNGLTGFSSKLDEYVIQYSSHSQGHALINAKLPRIILPLNRAETLLAYNGVGQSLEVIQFDKAASKFECHLVTFLDRSAAQDSDLLGYSIKDSPQSCKNCHGPSDRPNWSPYFLWPGSIGAIDDTPRPAEQEILSHFDSMRGSGDPKLARYAPLDQRASIDPVASQRESQGPPPAVINQVNASLTAAIFYLNGKRLAVEIRSNRELNPFRYAIMGAFACRTFRAGHFPSLPILDFLPWAHTRTRTPVTLETLLESDLTALRLIIDEERRARVKEVREAIGIVGNGRFATEAGLGPIGTTPGSLRFIVESVAGGSTRYWSTAFLGDQTKGSEQEDPLEFGDGFSSSESPKYLIDLLERSGNDQRLRDAADRHTKGNDRFCILLNAASRDEIESNAAASARLERLSHMQGE